MRQITREDERGFRAVAQLAFRHLTERPFSDLSETDFADYERCLRAMRALGEVMREVERFTKTDPRVKPAGLGLAMEHDGERTGSCALRASWRFQLFLLRRPSTHCGRGPQCLLP
jgi:hypothetical protein